MNLCKINKINVFKDAKIGSDEQIQNYANYIITKLGTTTQNKNINK